MDFSSSRAGTSIRESRFYPRLRAFLQRVKPVHRGQVKDAVCGRDRAADGRANFQGAQHLLFAARCENPELSTPRAKINLAIGHQRRGPDFALNLLRPAGAARFGIYAMKFAPAIGDEYQTLINRRRGQDMPLQWIRPD